MICDLAYQLQLDHLRAEYLAGLTAALSAGKADEIPSWDECQANFDAELAASPDPHMALLRELGVA